MEQNEKAQRARAPVANWRQLVGVKKVRARRRRRFRSIINRRAEVRNCVFAPHAPRTKAAPANLLTAAGLAARLS